MTLKLNGATSGSVSLDAPATGSDISFTLPGSTGTSGQLLSTDGSGVLSFVNGGKILQVVRATDTTERTTTSTSYVDASISVTITPQKSNSAIILFWSVIAESPSAGQVTYLRISDNSNNAISGAEETWTNGAAGVINTLTTAIAYATPNTTSATTYKGRFRVSSGTGKLRNTSTTGQLFAIEVAA